MAVALFVLKNTHQTSSSADVEAVRFEDLKLWVKSGYVLRRLFSYSEVRLITYSLDTLGRLLPTVLMLRVLARGSVVLADESGAEQTVSCGYLLALGWGFFRDWFAGSGLRRSESARAVALTHAERVADLDTVRPPLYVRTDFAFGVRSGGSVGHIAGVLNNLDAFLGTPILVSSDDIPTVRPDIERHIVAPGVRFRDFGEMWSAAYNSVLLEKIDGILAGRVPGVIYQRYSHNNLCGLSLARRFGIPLALEYNGSEVWMARNWGRPLKYEALAEQIELANLRGADLIVVVSKAMRDELANRGIDGDKILVNPNGVDPAVYSPDVDGSAVRAELGLDGRLVIGFIGTFGRWHGAEVLAEAFGLLLNAHPELRDRLRLLMIGDGVTMPAVRAAVVQHGIEDEVVLTGLVPQSEGPAHLAACDILASPHVPNPDGTPFFGSPTKLFEYMAMGRGIVASDLDQIGEVLDHDRTAWMVEPGSAEGLADGLLTLIEDADLRARLGRAAREEAVTKYTWLEHTRRIIEALKERCA